MGQELEIIGDGDGLAVVGTSTAVERFLAGVAAPTRDLDLPRLRSVLSTGGGAAQAGALVAADAGRWVKLTPDSAAALKKLPAMKGSSADVSRAIVMDKGKTAHILEFAKTPGSVLSNPAVLTGAAGMMTQLAMQQTMDEITDYLAAIDEKVDDILRAQKDSVLSRMIGAGLVIDEAMTIREHGGRVNEVTWSKVQTVPTTIAETQAYALRQLDALAEKLEDETAVGELADISRSAESTVHEWLAVLARCFQLQDAIAVLELDRVLTAAPEDLDGHRIGLREAREERRALICGTTQRLLGRMDAAAGVANEKVLLHPRAASGVVSASNQVAGEVTGFHEVLGIDEERQSLEARRWREAADDVRARALESGVTRVNVARRRGMEAMSRARTAADRLSDEVADRGRRRRPRRQRGDDAED